MAWWDSGLRFQCRPSCGRCCESPPGVSSVVLMKRGEASAIAAFLKISLRDFYRRFTELVGRRRSIKTQPHYMEPGTSPDACVFLNQLTRQCKIYTVRPAQCHTFPFWRENLHSPEAWARAGESCPGIGQGELITEEEITARLNLNSKLPQ